MIGRLTARDQAVYDAIWSRDTQSLPSSTAGAIAEALASRPGARAADLGAGVGRNALALAARGVHVDCVDHHPRAIAVLRRAARGLPMAVHHEDFADWIGARSTAAFDAVICFDALHHLEADEDRAIVRKVLADIRRTTMPGGQVLVTLLSDIEYSCGERPPGRGIFTMGAAESLLDEAFAGARCRKAHRKPVVVPETCGYDPSSGRLVPTSYRATRVLRWFELPGQPQAGGAK